MVTLITIIHVFACLFLILVVLLQAGKGGGMGIAFGSSTSALGVRRPWRRLVPREADGRHGHRLHVHVDLARLLRQPVRFGAVEEARCAEAGAEEADEKKSTEKARTRRCRRRRRARQAARHAAGCHRDACRPRRLRRRRPRRRPGQVDVPAPPRRRRRPRRPAAGWTPGKAPGCGPGQGARKGGSPGQDRSSAPGAKRHREGARSGARSVVFPHLSLTGSLSANPGHTQRDALAPPCPAGAAGCAAPLRGSSPGSGPQPGHRPLSRHLSADGDPDPTHDVGLLRPRFGLPAIAQAGSAFPLELLERGGPAVTRAALLSPDVDDATAERCLAGAGGRRAAIR